MDVVVLSVGVTFVYVFSFHSHFFLFFCSLIFSALDCLHRSQAGVLEITQFQFLLVVFESNCCSEGFEMKNMM